ncbi:MAG: hypothetical protein QXO24_03390 [Candidatus Micrarchaeaceae archaeon]
MSDLDGEKKVLRDARGRFIPGTAGGPGRPPRAAEEAYLEALKSAVSLSRFRRIVAAIAEKAEKGDVRAFVALAKYILLPAEARTPEEEPVGEIVFDLGDVG